MIPRPPEPNAPGDAAPAGSTARVLVVGSDPATLGLLREWLDAEGQQVVEERADGEAAGGAVAAAIVDVPYARHGGTELLRRVTERHPGTPILALSATFFSSVQCTGECARSLGVAAVLPKPVARETLVAAVRNLLRR